MTQYNGSDMPEVTYKCIINPQPEHGVRFRSKSEVIDGTHGCILAKISPENQEKYVKVTVETSENIDKLYIKPVLYRKFGDDFQPCMHLLNKIKIPKNVSLLKAKISELYDDPCEMTKESNNCFSSKIENYHILRVSNDSEILKKKYFMLKEYGVINSTIDEINKNVKEYMNQLKNEKEKKEKANEIVSTY